MLLLPVVLLFDRFRMIFYAGIGIVMIVTKL